MYSDEQYVVDVEQYVVDVEQYVADVEHYMSYVEHYMSHVEHYMSHVEQHKPYVEHRMSHVERYVGYVEQIFKTFSYVEQYSLCRTICRICRTILSDTSNDMSHKMTKASILVPTPNLQRIGRNFD